MNDISLDSIFQEKEHEWKELLYILFYEIKSEILGCKIEIEEEEYQENIRLITIPNLVKYIHDSIQILIIKKTEEAKKKQKEEDDKFYLAKLSGKNLKNKNINFTTDQKQTYENIIKKLESNERNLYKIIFQDKLRSDAMESKIGEYMEMENEFEEMKAKLKYEGGRFLNNDRKDNEIIIIRTENTNLKNIIKKLEEKIQKNSELQLSKDRLINDLKDKIKSLEKNKIEIKNNINNSVREQLNLINGINININNGLNSKNKAKGKNNHHSNNNSLHSHKHISHISDESLSLKDRLNITEKKKGLTSKIKSIHFTKTKKSKEKEIEKKYEPFPMTRNKSFEKVKDDFLKRYFLKNSTIKGIKNINYKKPKQKPKQTYYRVNDNKMNIANSSAYIPFFNNKKDLTNLFSIKKILMSGNRSSSAKRKRTSNNSSINYKSVF